MSPSEPGDDLSPVGFDLLATAAAVATLTSQQFVVDELEIEFKALGKSVDPGKQTGTVGFTGGGVAQRGHGRALPGSRLITSSLKSNAC